MDNEMYVLGLDQGTISSRAAVFNQSSEVIGLKQIAFNQFYPKSGWVEHDPLELWHSLLDAAVGALEEAKISASQIVSIGLANQRETTVIWNKKTGKPLYNAIVWQCRRSSNICRELHSKQLENDIHKKTGLYLDPYFSATKLMWLFRENPSLYEVAKRGELAFGTVDSWILFNLTGQHLTDSTNASRTLLYNINTKCWDKELLELFNIPENILPEIKPTTSDFGFTKKEIFGIEIPVNAVVGDQQAALFGQCCYEEGSCKNTYGVGSFTLVNTGNNLLMSKNNLLTTIAWDMGTSCTYALEGSVFGSGSAIDWIQEELRVISDTSELERLAKKVPDCNGLVMVPSFNGMGAPYWDPDSRASLLGISSGTTKAHLVRAILESIAYQTCDIINAMEQDIGETIPFLKADGGSSKNNFLMQFQADILNKPILLSFCPAVTCLGAAYFAGLKAKYWLDISELNRHWIRKIDFMPGMFEEKRKNCLNRWKKAIDSTRSFK